MENLDCALEQVAVSRHGRIIFVDEQDPIGHRAPIGLELTYGRRSPASVIPTEPDGDTVSVHTREHPPAGEKRRMTEHHSSSYAGKASEQPV
jgi:hypothetical protein